MFDSEELWNREHEPFVGGVHLDWNARSLSDMAFFLRDELQSHVKGFCCDTCVAYASYSSGVCYAQDPTDESFADYLRSLWVVRSINETEFPGVRENYNQLYYYDLPILKLQTPGYSPRDDMSLGK